MNRKKSIVYLNRSQIEPHPENPRKDLGDLTELRDSIRENGIMQNLTVIPTDDSFEHFRILIGHRRFAASEGIVDELPCVIVEDITPNEQVGIMLCENIQRNDLTLIEQAHGFQLMMDLGEDLGTISKKTGFSEKTVKHRLEIAKLNSESLDKATSFQLTLNDFIELEKIPDVKEREKIIKNAYSSENIRSTVSFRLREIEKQKLIDKIREALKPLGIKEYKSKTNCLCYQTGYEKIVCLSISEGIKKIVSEVSKYNNEIQNVEYQFYYDYIYLCRKVDEKKPKKASNEETPWKKKEENRHKIHDLTNVIVNEYAEFINELPDAAFKSLTFSERNVLLRDIWNLIVDSDVSLFDDYFSFNNQQINDSLKENGIRNREVEWQMLILIASAFVDYSLAKWSGEADIGTIEEHKRFIKILNKFGFSLRDEELLSLINGTSELFEQTNEEPEDDEEV